MKMNKLITATLALSALAASSAFGAISLHFVYDPATDTTTASYSGTWGLDATDSAPSFVFRSSASLDISFEGGALQVFYNTENVNVGFVETSTTSFTTPWAVATATSASGDPFGFDGFGAIGGSNLLGPVDFTASTSIVGSLEFAGSDLTELGFDAAEIANGGSIDLGDGAIVNWTANVVPEPSTLSCLFSISLLLIARRRV